MTMLHTRRLADHVVVLVVGLACILGAMLCYAEASSTAAFVWFKVVGIGLIMGALWGKWTWDARGVVRFPTRRGV